jgi:hypothetical protein
MGVFRKPAVIRQNLLIVNIIQADFSFAATVTFLIDQGPIRKTHPYVQVLTTNSGHRFVRNRHAVSLNHCRRRLKGNHRTLPQNWSELGEESEPAVRGELLYQKMLTKPDCSSLTAMSRSEPSIENGDEAWTTPRPVVHEEVPLPTHSANPEFRPSVC